MILSGRRFRPRWWSVLLTATGIVLFSTLGFWQLERAALKEDIATRFEERLAQDYQPYTSRADDEVRDLEYRKVLLDGRYDSTRTLLVDNQVNRGRAGYHVVTPLRLRDSDRVVLVNRGWAPWGESRQQIEPVAVPAQAGEVAGIAYFPSDPAFDFGGGESAGEWPRLITHIDIDALQAEFDGRLLPWVLWLAPEVPGSYVREWKPVWMQPEKSRAYATQWFAFAGLALLFFVFLNLRKVE